VRNQQYSTSWIVKCMPAMDGRLAASTARPSHNVQRPATLPSTIIGPALTPPPHSITASSLPLAAWRACVRVLARRSWHGRVIQEGGRKRGRGRGIWENGHRAEFGGVASPVSSHGERASGRVWRRRVSGVQPWGACIVHRRPRVHRPSSALGYLLPARHYGLLAAAPRLAGLSPRFVPVAFRTFEISARASACCT
jgi:hypothetical protein